MATEPFIGEIRMFGFTYPPKGWALCDGQLLPINQNQALFSILGTTYGGNGQTNVRAAEPAGEGGGACGKRHRAGPGGRQPVGDAVEQPGGSRPRSIVERDGELVHGVGQLSGVGADRTGTLRPGGGHGDEPGGPLAERRLAAAQQSTALPGSDLLHRVGRNLSIAQLKQRRNHGESICRGNQDVRG